MSEYDSLPNPLAPLGSGIYYALRFAPRSRRSDLALGNSLIQTLRRIPPTCSDPRVAREKLAWWRQELEQTARGDASHPLARASRPLLQHHCTRERLAPLFAALIREIDGTQPPDLPTLRATCRSGEGFRQGCLTLLAGGDAAETALAEDLGSWIGLVETIRDLGRPLRRGICPLPADLLQRHGIPPAGMLETSPERLRPLLQELATAARREYAAIRQRLPEAPAPALGCALGYATMAAELLQALEQEGFLVIRQRTSLTPLRKLWLARRGHRQARGSTLAGAMLDRLRRRIRPL